MFINTKALIAGAKIILPVSGVGGGSAAIISENQSKNWYQQELLRDADKWWEERKAIFDKVGAKEEEFMALKVKNAELEKKLEEKEKSMQFLWTLLEEKKTDLEKLGYYLASSKR